VGGGAVEPIIPHPPSPMHPPPNIIPFTVRLRQPPPPSSPSFTFLQSYLHPPTPSLMSRVQVQEELISDFMRKNRFFSLKWLGSAMEINTCPSLPAFIQLYSYGALSLPACLHFFLQSHLPACLAHSTQFLGSPSPTHACLQSTLFLCNPSPTHACPNPTCEFL
jgi:hypothetical protein